jgi:rubrerythrin
MNNDHLAWEQQSYRRSRLFSRRGILANGALAGIGVAGAVGFQAIATVPSLATSMGDNDNDAKILNNALFYEHQAIWAYNFAAGKLTDTEVGKAVLAVALRNQKDHIAHRDLLAEVVRKLGGKPVEAQSSYDLSSYLDNGEGNIDSDVNLAKLALALETDAAIAYTQEAARLKTPALITAGASIGTNESAHAAAIRATFKALGMDLEIVPSAFVGTDSRSSWVLTV